MINSYEHFLTPTLKEGPRDPHIFKVIFTAGIPGSGKTTIIKKLTEGSGLKSVNFDSIYEYLKNKNFSKDYVVGKSETLTDKKFDMYLKSRLGMIMDKTAWDYEKIKKIKDELESMGYDSMMIYVNTDPTIAKERVKSRYLKTGRNVDNDYIDKVFKKLSGNIGKYQNDFSGNFIIVDNSSNSDFNLEWASKRVNRFLSEKPRKPAASLYLKNTP